MADITLPDGAEVRAQWGDFAWTKANAAKAEAIIARGHMLADATAILGAMDIVFGECDR